MRRPYAHESGRDDEPRVTVCVPLYDYEQYVVDALDSVADQSLEPLALTVVDDGSHDRGPERVADWMAEHRDRFSRLQLLQHPENRGLAHARNTAVADAGSEFVFMLDADNSLHRPCLERLVDGIGEDAAAYSLLAQFGDAHHLMGCDAWSTEQLAQGNYIDAMALVRRSAWRAVGGYRAMQVTGWEDYDFWCRFVESGLRGVLVPEVLGRYRVHGRSMLRSTTDTLRNHVDVCDEIVRAHPWTHLGNELGGGGALGDWRTSRLARSLVSIPFIGGLSVPAINLWIARLRNLRERSHAAVTRGAVARRCWRLRRELEPASAGQSRIPMLARLILLPGRGEGLQRRVGASALARASTLGEREASDESPQPIRDPIPISIHASSQGNFFFREIAHHLAGGLEASGAFEIRHCDENDEPPEDVEQRIIVAPHEFFGLGSGRRFDDDRYTSFRRTSTLFLAEQLGTKFYAYCLPYAIQARLVLDLDPNSAALLRALGIRAAFLPLGPVPGLPLFEGEPGASAPDLRRFGQPPMPDHDVDVDTETLDHRPIDVLFNGVATPRRTAFFARNSAFFARHHCCLLLPTAARPLSREVPSALETRDATALARRAKIQLNIHRGEFAYFEWHRLVVRGLMNRSLVVSEPCARPPDFEPGHHYVEAPLDEIPERLRWLLDSEEGRAAAERIRRAGHARLVERFDLATWGRALHAHYRGQPPDGVQDGTMLGAGAESSRIAGLRDGRP